MGINPRADVALKLQAFTLALEVAACLEAIQTDDAAGALMLDALRERVDAALASWNHGPERLCSLISYPYLIEALGMMG